jgi:hypothetical protein
MKFTNTTGLPAAWTMGFRRDGRELLVAVVKATYTLPLPGEAAQAHDTQVPLVKADIFTGEPGLSAPRFESDFAHSKAACDLLLVGSAHAPHGQATTRCPVGLRVGNWQKQFLVIGPRRWQRGLMGISASAPEPFLCQHLSYDVAFGGTDRTQEAEGLVHAYAANPAGRGWCKHAAHIDGQLLPATEAPGQSIKSPHGDYAPQSFSPIGRNWQPRMSYVGTYDQHWIENTAPLWPADFDERYFQAAPPDQIIPYPQGGETVVLQHLTADGLRAFSLPDCLMPVTFIPHRGRDVTQAANLDTIVFEPDEERFTLTWRSVLAMGRSIFDVKELIIGEMPAEWHRERRFPGKLYHQSLADAVRAKAASTKETP